MMMNPITRNNSLAICCYAFIVTTTNASAVTDTKTQLQQLENKMMVLEQTIHSVHSRREALNLEIARSEKEISNTVRQLATIQHNISEKRQQIQVQKELIDTLNHQMATQRELLAKHLRARYKMGDHQPVKWLLNQENPYAISRLLTFYQYVVKARQTTIHQIMETQARLNQNQEKLNQETQQQQLLESQVKQRQAQLNQTKQYHAALILSLDKDVQTKQQTMQDYQHDKGRLSQLINTLTQQGLTTRHYPLTQIRRHLPNPVHTAPENIEKINQGLIFYANEGDAVSAVFPGKVIFSDWLKGYGLLLIVDHGDGYMTLYAHNQALFRQKGEFVDQGEKIATIGHTGGLRKNGLYFEIRHGGKTISPSEWLAG